MNFRRPRIYLDGQFKIALISFIMLVIAVFSATSGLKVLSNSGIKNNLFFVQVVNYAIPLVKSTSFDEETMAESQFSIRDAILQSIGININNPLSLMSREVSYFKSITLSISEGSTPDIGFSFNPFKLDESMIFKQSPNSLPNMDDLNQGSGENKNNEEDDPSIPNKIVNIYDPKYKKPLNSAKPEVLIYHSHTTESYKPNGADNDDPLKNIVAVGGELKDELEKNYGIAVIHDKTVHSKPAYTKSYTRSRETLDKYLKQYGDFKLIIDMHRDAGTTKKSVTTKLNGKNTAKIMFVMSKGNPRLASNQLVVNKLLGISNNLFPDFDRGIYYWNNKYSHFNADRSNNAVLIEVGSVINELDEAKESAKYLGRIIGEYINGKR